MKKKINYVISIIVLIAIVNPIFASEWHMPRKNQERTGVVNDHELETPLSRKWSYNAGWSISSPLVAGSFIYHLADAHVYKIPVSVEGNNGILSHNKTQKVKVSGAIHTGSDPTYDSRNNLLFIGSGDKSLVMVNSNDLSIKDVVNTEVRLVSAPHLLSNNTVAYASATERDGSSSKNAMIYIVKYDPNFIEKPKFKDYQFDQLMNNSNAEITGTFADMGGDRFLVPYNIKGKDDRGYVVAWQAHTSGVGPPSLSPLWYRDTKVGVSTTPVYDKSRDRVYYVDKRGNVYAVNASNGAPLIPGKDGIIYPNNLGSTLSNNSPALYKNILVVPYRYTEVSGGFQKNGKVLGIDVTTGKKLWEYTLPDDTDNVTTSPIVVTFGNDAEQTEVHFGTAKGKLVKLSNIEGGQAALKAEIQSIPDYPVREDITSYYQGVGLSSGIVAAGGLYLFGINTRQVPNEKGLGSLFAYNTTRADFYVESIEGRKSVSKGDQLNTRVKVGNRVKKDFPKVEVTLELHNNNGLVRKLGSKDVNFSTAYDQKNQATFSWEVNEEPGNYKLVAEINPAGPNRIVESDYTNNKAEASLEVGKEPQKRICTPNEKDAMSTITETWCNGVDEEGIPICRDQDIEITLDIDELLAYATKVKEDQSLEKLPEIGGNVEMKAGQGFVIEVDSALNYYPPPNDTQKYPGSFRVSLVVDNDPNIYELEPTNGDRSHINTWYLKEAWLPMFEGEMVYNVQPNGNYISGGRAYYTKLDQADGMIAYKIKIETVGPGLNLSECLDKEIKVKGSIFDDIYVRRINPAKPFNHLQNSSQIGPTWSGTTILDNYAKWWTGERDLPDNNYIYKRFKIKNGNEENLE